MHVQKLISRINNQSTLRNMYILKPMSRIISWILFFVSKVYLEDAVETKRKKKFRSRFRAAWTNFNDASKWKSKKKINKTAGYHWSILRFPILVTKSFKKDENDFFQLITPSSSYFLNFSNSKNFLIFCQKAS